VGNKICKAEITSQAVEFIAKSFLKMDVSRETTAIRGSAGLKFHPSDNANATADCSEIQFKT
jgi:hypothetical protein